MFYEISGEYFVLIYTDCGDIDILNFHELRFYDIQVKYSVLLHIDSGDMGILNLYELIFYVCLHLQSFGSSGIMFRYSYHCLCLTY